MRLAWPVLAWPGLANAPKQTDKLATELAGKNLWVRLMGWLRRGEEGEVIWSLQRDWVAANRRTAARHTHTHPGSRKVCLFISN